MSRTSIAKYLAIMRISGKIDMKPFGPAKVYFISQRVPLNAMLNFTSDQILVIDEDMKIKQINDQFLSFWDVKDTIIGQDLKSLKNQIISCMP